MRKSFDFQARSLSIGMKIHDVKMMKWASTTNRDGIVRTMQTLENWQSTISFRYLGTGGYSGQIGWDATI